MPNPANGQTALSGTLGKAVIDSILVTRLTSWRLRESVSESTWGDSDSQGFTNRKAARTDGTGSIGGKFDTNRKPYAIFSAGDLITLALWQTATAGDYWAFPSALIQSFELELSPDSKEVVGWAADFGADGIFYFPGEVGAPTYNLPSS